MNSSQPARLTTGVLGQGEDTLLPESLLRVALSGPHAVPIYLTCRDEVWVRELIRELDGMVGRTTQEVLHFLENGLIPMMAEMGAGPRAVRGVAHVLRRMWPTQVAAPAPPSEIRQTLFQLAAQGADRQEAIRRTAQLLCISPEAVLPSLFADRPGFRRLVELSPIPAPGSTVQLYNLALLQGLLLRSHHVEAHAKTHVRSVVRWAKLKRLICSYSMQPQGTAIDLSGPLALFRQTTRYGYALASFLPALVATPGWSLRAQCVLQSREVTIDANAHDPIALTQALPKETDSSIERRLMRDVSRLGSAWLLHRETVAVKAGPRVFFPDFSLQKGTDIVHVEIVGYYTPEYLSAKLQTLRDAKLTRFVVCIDDSLACANEEIAADGVLRYRGKIDAQKLVGLAEEVLVGS